MRNRCTFLEPAHLELRPVCSGVGGEQAVQRRAGPTLPAQPGQQAADLAVPLRAGFRLLRQFDGGENGLKDGGRDVVVPEDGGQQVQQLWPSLLSNFLIIIFSINKNTCSLHRWINASHRYSDRK
jgi:hypothetical protein